jgi:hypothetical protein
MDYGCMDIVICMVWLYGYCTVYDMVWFMLYVGLHG